MNAQICAVLLSAVTMGLSARAQTGGGPPGPASPLTVGAWSAPYDISISCTTSMNCGSCSVNFDEIGHAALIPAGPHAGRVLVWTRCDNSLGHGEEEYKTYIWDPADPLESPAASAETSPLIRSVLNPSGPFNNGPFCSGHAWILDAEGNPKLFTVGGTDYSAVCNPTLSFYCGHPKVYWFDPGLGTWSDAPRDLYTGVTPVRNWYPSVITFLETASKFSPIVLGGSPQQGQGCGLGPLSSGGSLQLPYQYQDWWALPSPYLQGSASWATYTDSNYSWQWYPRPFLLEDGAILTAGSDLACEAPYSTAAGQYGGNPVQVVIPPYQMSSSTRYEGLDPNPSLPSAPTVGGWSSCNAVILHTLKNKTLWDPPNWSSNYAFDRVIVTGGFLESIEDDGDTDIPALSSVLELRNANTPSEAWVTKNSSPRARCYGNFVLLPDGTIFYCGGQNHSNGGTSSVPMQLVYWNQSESFNPDSPSQPGVWKDMDSRRIMGSVFPIGDYATPRGYHSVALLLKDGTVALMGGQPADPAVYQAPDLNSEDSVEIFQPPYHFRTGRLRITGLPPSPNEDMRYGSTYCIAVNDPSKVAYACLIGIGSTTHHFDYGQRYVELEVTTDTTSCSGGNAGANVQILAPPTATLAPEGFYLLFVVELRTVPIGQVIAVPSKGEFVKLRF